MKTKIPTDFVTYQKALDMLEECNCTIPSAFFSSSMYCIPNSSIVDLLQQEVVNKSLPIYELVRGDDALGNSCAERFEQRNDEYLTYPTDTKFTFLVCFAYVRFDDIQKVCKRLKKIKKELLYSPDLYDNR